MGVEASPQPPGLPPSSHLCSEPPDTSHCSLGPGLNKLWNINSALSRVPELHACPPVLAALSLSLLYLARKGMGSGKTRINTG